MLLLDVWIKEIVILDNVVPCLQRCKGYVGSKNWALKGFWVCFFPEPAGTEINLSIFSHISIILLIGG